MSPKIRLLCIAFGFTVASCAASDAEPPPPLFDGHSDGFLADSNQDPRADTSQQRTTTPDASTSNPPRDTMTEGTADIEVSVDAPRDNDEVVSSADGDQPSAPDDGVEPDEPEVITADLYGATPTTALGPPAFTAVNSDESTRTVANLVGSPTILWFFPFAGSPG